MIEFHSDDIVTHIPTCCLIEDYWMVRTALDEMDSGDLTGARETLNGVMDCLMESIDRFTQVKSGLYIEPSVSSPIAMSCESGIIMNDRHDLRCQAGLTISYPGAYHCGDCRHMDVCDPEDGVYLLEGNIRYQPWGRSSDEEFVKALKKEHNKSDSEEMVNR